MTCITLCWKRLWTKPRRGALRTQKLKTHLLRTQRTQSLKALSRSQYSHACYAYRQGFLISTDFYPPGPFTCIVSKTSPRVFFSSVLAVAGTGSGVGLQNEIGHPACRLSSLRGVGERAQYLRPLYPTSGCVRPTASSQTTRSESGARRVI